MAGRRPRPTLGVPARLTGRHQHRRCGGVSLIRVVVSTTSLISLDDGGLARSPHRDECVGLFHRRPSASVGCRGSHGASCSYVGWDQLLWAERRATHSRD